MDIEKKGEENLSDALEYIQMGQVLMGAEKYRDAIEKFDKALKEEPMNKIAYISKGIAHANLEEFSAAKECFKRCIMIDKNFADAYFQLGNMSFLEDEFQEGIKNYNQAIALGYQSAELYFNLALVYEERNEVDEAIRYYTKAASLDETKPDYLIRKATLQILLQRYEEALQTLEKVRNIFPESFEGYHLTAAAYTMLEQYEKADTILKDAMERFPDDIDILFDRMRVLITRGELDEAILLLSDAKQRNCTPEEKKEILLNEAQIYGQQEKTEDTKRLLNEALEIQEGRQFDSEIRYLLMIAYLMDKDFSNMLRIAKQVDPSDTADSYNLCGVYFEGVAMKGLKLPDVRKTFQDGVKYYRSISMKDPSRVDAYLFRAMCYKELGDYEKAMESLDYMILLKPEDSQLHYIKGNLLREQGKENEAQKEYQEARRYGLNKTFWEFVG